MEPQQGIGGSTLPFWLVEIVITLWVGSLVGLKTCGQECQATRFEKEYLRFCAVVHVLARWWVALLIHHLGPLNASVSNACTKLDSLSRFSRRNCTCGSCRHCRASIYGLFFLPHFHHHCHLPDHLLLQINPQSLNFQLPECFVGPHHGATSTCLAATSSLASSTKLAGDPSGSCVATDPSLWKTNQHPSSFSHWLHLCSGGSAGFDLIFVSPTSIFCQNQFLQTYMIAITCYNDKLYIICKVINL